MLWDHFIIGQFEVEENEVIWERENLFKQHKTLFQIRRPLRSGRTLLMKVEKVCGKTLTIDATCVEINEIQCCFVVFLCLVFTAR